MVSRAALSLVAAVSQVAGKDWCSDGISAIQDGVWICCASKCGSCDAASDCADRPGGKWNCCADALAKDGDPCEKVDDTGCYVPADPPSPTPAPSPRPSPSPVPSPSPRPSPSPGPSGDPPRVLLKPHFGWSLQAWGWNDGGKDSNANHKVVDVDLDDQKDDIAGLVADGHIVLCYFSSGTLEGWRPDCNAPDGGSCSVHKDQWQKVLAGQMSDWDEAWLDITKLDDLKVLMEPRFKKARDYGCHGVEPDNVDCYSNSDCKASGKSKAAQIAYNKWQAEYAHSLGLAIVLKNTVELIDELMPFYDAAMNEQCNKYSECDGYSTFIAANKAVFGVEYSTSTTHCSDLCKCANEQGIQLKYCSGSESSGLCKSGSWTNCFNAETPLPDTPCTRGSYKDGRCSDAATIV